MSLTDYLAAEAANFRVRRKLTEAEARTMIAEYQGGAAIQPLITKWRMSQERFYRLLAAAGVPVRSIAESTTLWHAANKKTTLPASAGSESQLNEGYEFSTPATAKPPRPIDTSDVPCGWDGVSHNVIKVARGERTCLKCGAAVTSKKAATCETMECDGALVDTITALGLRDGEWVME